MLKIRPYDFRGRIVLAAFLLTSSSSLSLHAQGYTKEHLVSSFTGNAPHVDPNLVNPWGIAALPTGPWWASDAGTGLSTVYDGDGNVMSLVVSIPPSASSTDTKGHTSGIVANATPDFGAAKFIFAGLDGAISAWTSGSTAIIKVDNGATAVYTGLTNAMMGDANTLYAANFKGGTVEVYDTSFTWVTMPPDAFKDTLVPAGFSPFNVQAINGQIYVAYAKVGTDGEEQRGGGLGFVTIFTPQGQLVRRLQHGPHMNAPWGVAWAPADFGRFSNHILVGQFGSGFIAAFDATTGEYHGVLKDTEGKPIRARNLWGIAFGNGGPAGATNALYLAFGPGDEQLGVFARVTAN